MNTLVNWIVGFFLSVMAGLALFMIMDWVSSGFGALNPWVLLVASIGWGLTIAIGAVKKRLTEQVLMSLAKLAIMPVVAISALGMINSTSTSVPEESLASQENLDMMIGQLMPMMLHVLLVVSVLGAFLIVFSPEEGKSRPQPSNRSS